MTDPRPLTRNELAEFLPNQRAIRAFEKLFDLIPDELTSTTVQTDTAALTAAAARAEATRLKERIAELEEFVFLKRSPELGQLKERIDLIENQLTLPNRVDTDQLRLRVEMLEQQLATYKKPNTDHLVKRIEILESLVG
jgi:hypothetical protein